jgi:hypothetical protein
VASQLNFSRQASYYPGASITGPADKPMHALHHTIMNAGFNAWVMNVRACWRVVRANAVVVNVHSSVHQPACSINKAD